MSGTTQYDVVIVGAGIAGALVAKRLTSTGLKVLVLEAGPDTTRSTADYTTHLGLHTTFVQKLSLTYYTHNSPFV